MPICYDDDSFYDFLSTGDGSHVSRKILMEGDSWISHPQVHNLSRAMDYEGEGDYGILNLGNHGADLVDTGSCNRGEAGRVTVS